MDQLDATRVIGERARGPFFPSDGQWMRFFDQGQLKKIAVSGGSAPVVLCDVPGSDSGVTWGGASWGDDGMIVFAQNPGGIYRVSDNGGEPDVLISLNDKGVAQLPQVLPGGDAIVFTWRPGAGSSQEAQIVVQSLETGEQTVLIEEGRAGRYAPTGHLVYSTQGTILAVALDVSGLTVAGGSVPLIENMMPVAGPSQLHFSFSESGALVFVPISSTLNTVPMWVSHEGREEPLAITAMPYDRVQLSPDGTRAALDVMSEEENPDIWIYDLVRETTTRFTFDAAEDSGPVWTPDGERIVFRSARDGGGLFWRRADGTGSVERLTSDGGIHFPSTISPDGRHVVFHEIHPTNSWDIKTVTLDGERIVEPLLATPFDERRPSVSLDGRWMAYQSNESGQFDVFVRPFPDVDGGKWQVSRDGGNSPVWARDGK